MPFFGSFKGVSKKSATAGQRHRRYIVVVIVALSPLSPFLAVTPFSPHIIRTQRVDPLRCASHWTRAAQPPSPLTSHPTSQPSQLGEAGLWTPLVDDFWGGVAPGLAAFMAAYLSLPATPHAAPLLLP